MTENNNGNNKIVNKCNEKIEIDINENCINNKNFNSFNSVLENNKIK